MVRPAQVRGPHQAPWPPPEPPVYSILRSWRGAWQVVERQDLGRRYEADSVGLIEGAQQISLPPFARQRPRETQRPRSLEAGRASAWSQAVVDQGTDLATLDPSAVLP